MTVNRDPNEMSLQAYNSIKDSLGELQSVCFNAIRYSGQYGITQQELEQNFPNLIPSTVRTRVSELCKLGLVEKTSEKRNTKSGRGAAVYCAKNVKSKSIFDADRVQL